MRLFSIALLLALSLPVNTSAAALSCAELPAIFAALASQHYMRPKIDETLKQNAVVQFVDILDASKTALLEAEVSKLKAELPQAFSSFRNGDCRALSDAYEIVIARGLKDQAFAASFLGDGYAVDGKAEVVLDPKKRGYAKSEEERQTRLKAFLHFQMANYLSSGLKLEQAKKQLVHRYELQSKRLKERQAKGEVPAYFAEAFAQALDPHSAYMSADQLNNFQIQMRLSLEGIGASLSSQDGFIVVETLVPGGAAEKNGKLRPKDKIVAVQQENEQPVSAIDMELDAVVKMIRGPKGTLVTLTVLREGDKARTFQLQLKRDRVDVASQAAKIDYQTRKVGERTLTIGVIDLPSFYGGEGGRSSYKDVKALLQQAVAKKVDALVLDLSKNGGGLLEDAVRISGLFIARGAIVGTRDNNQRMQVLEDEDEEVVYNGPLVVETSPASASAAEILAGALQDYHRAIIVGGEHTFGKGSVQTIVPLTPELGAIKVTIAMFFLPAGKSTQQCGVPADVRVPTLFDANDMNEATLDNALPPQSTQPFLSNTANASSRRWTPVTAQTIAALNAKSKARRTGDAGFAKLEKKIETLKASGIVKIGELRKKGEGKAEKKSAAAEDKKDKEEDDELKKLDTVVLKEAVNIATDAATL